MSTLNPNVKSFWPEEDSIVKELDRIEVAILWEELAILNEEALLLMQPKYETYFTYFTEKHYIVWKVLTAWKALKGSV